MPVSLSLVQLRAVRMHAQLLAGDRPADVAEAVAGVGSLQAQSWPAAALAVRARTTGLSRADVDRALAVDRTVVRSWLMRGTLHIVAAADLGWMTALLGPTVARTSHRRRLELGLDDDLCERGLEAIGRVLRGRAPMRQPELVERLADEGVAVARGTQAPVHLMLLAATEGLVCRGPEAGRDATYALVDEWVPRGPVLDRAEALAELARRYLRSHGPASVRDFATWSGLPAADARAGFDAIRPELVDVDVEGAPMAALAETDLGASRLPLRLVGMFDEYLLGYRTREVAVDDRFARRVQDGGIIRAAVLWGGRVVGTWRLRGGGRTQRLSVEPFAPPPRSAVRELAGEAADVGRFLGVAVDVEVRRPG